MRSMSARPFVWNVANASVPMDVSGTRAFSGREASAQQHTLARELASARRKV